MTLPSNLTSAPATFVLNADVVKDAARQCGFGLVGLARAEALDPRPFSRWIQAGYAADMAWMNERVEHRMDPRVVLPGCETVVALAIPYHLPDAAPSMIAQYARGRDYHYTHRDRLKTFRRALLKLDPDVATYACVDTGVVMEKAWAERAGLGWIGKNGCLITPSHGSWVTLSALLMNRKVTVYDTRHPESCGTCDLCLRACPTGAFPEPGVVDARKCLSYQTIENRNLVPLDLRPRVRGHVFGCDVCQDVCPFNHDAIPEGDARFAPRELGVMPPEQIAALSREEFKTLSPGMALARPGYDGIRRNALLAMGAATAARVLPLLTRLADDESAVVAETAKWVRSRVSDKDPVP